MDYLSKGSYRSRPSEIWGLCKHSLGSNNDAARVNVPIVPFHSTEDCVFNYYNCMNGDMILIDYYPVHEITDRSGSLKTAAILAESPLSGKSANLELESPEEFRKALEQIEENLRCCAHCQFRKYGFGQNR